MCEFQKVTCGECPECSVTGDRCTLCVMGNAETYREGKERVSYGTDPKTLRED